MIVGSLFNAVHEFLNIASNVSRLERECGVFWTNGVLIEAKKFGDSFSPSLCSDKEEPVFFGDVLLRYVWQKLHSNSWNDVAEEWRELYSIATMLKVDKSIRVELTNGMETNQSFIRQNVKYLDLAILMGHSRFCLAINEAIESLLAFLPVVTDNGETWDIKAPQIINLPLKNSIPVVYIPSIQSFKEKFIETEQPVVIKDVVRDWPAFKSWCRTAYLRKEIGERTVPVEIGSSYTSNDWRQSLMTVNEFISNHVLNFSGDVAYLAQHNMFHQIPKLTKDIIIPDYCYAISDSTSVRFNAWFGPIGTVSPLHYDPDHNLLSQVIGYKYVRLYAPSQSVSLYPHDASTMLSNTSKVNVENPDVEIFPNFCQAPFLETVLHPGDMLYIPPKWWHFIKSQTVSFSVNFWF